MMRVIAVACVAGVVACGGSLANDGLGGGPSQDSGADTALKPCDATCEPTLLAANASKNTLRATDSFVFYFTSAPSLTRRSLADGKIENLATATSALGNPGQLRLTDEFALWLSDSETESGVAFRCGLAPLAPVQRVAMDGAIAIAATKGRLYIGLQNRIDVSALDGKDRTPAWSEVKNLVAMDAANGSVVWLERGTIEGAASLRIGRPGEFVSDVSNSLTLPTQFSFDGTDLVFATKERASGKIVVRKRAPGLDALTSALATFDDAVVAVANDAAGAVIATDKGDLFALDGAGRRRITKASVAPPTSPEALRVTPQYVLWISSSGLWRAPRACGCG